MRWFVSSLFMLLLVGGFSLLGSSTNAGDKPEAKPEPKQVKHPYVHTVIFYIKKDAPKGEVSELIADSHKLLAKIPTVHGLRAGRPAEKGTPNVAVTDYSVGLTIMFDDFEGLNTYLVHPLHVEFVTKHTPYIDRVLVYDFANQDRP